MSIEMRSVRALSSVSNSRFHRLFSKVMIALCLSLVYLKNSLATQVATISTDPERLMEYCSPKGKDMPHDAPVQVGIVERADPSVCEKHGNFSKHNTKTASVKYVAYFYKNCSVFDAFYEEKELKIKDTEKMYFVQGFKRGLTGMCKGEIRRIFVPSKYGYGRSGAAYIPGNTTLVYEVEMITLDNAKGRERERKKKEEQKRKRNKKQRRV